MKLEIQKIILIVSALLIFTLFNYGIYQKEKIKRRGETVFLHLSPIDPRSLIQGDYMLLRYAIEENHSHLPKEKRGYIVLTIDEKKVGTFKQFYEGEIIGKNEKLMHYHKVSFDKIEIVPDSFMFQEGDAKLYQEAKYGIFKFDNHNNYILSGLADDQLQTIKPKN